MSHHPLLDTFWTTTLESVGPDEFEYGRAALRDVGRLPIVARLAFFVFSGWENFPISDLAIVSAFVEENLDLLRGTIATTQCLRYPADGYVRVKCNFVEPVEVWKKAGFFSASLTRTFSSHIRVSNFICRLEQPILTHYIPKVIYDEYVLAHANHEPAA